MAVVAVITICGIVEVAVLLPMYNPNPIGD